MALKVQGVATGVSISGGAVVIGAGSVGVGLVGGGPASVFVGRIGGASVSVGVGARPGKLHPTKRIEIKVHRSSSLKFDIFVPPRSYRYKWKRMQQILRSCLSRQSTQAFLSIDCVFILRGPAQAFLETTFRVNNMRISRIKV
jgi:hypothetical protein